MAEKKIVTELYGVELLPRMLVRPTASVAVTTEEQKMDVLRSARRVISKHREVLIALRDREQVAATTSRITNTSPSR